MSVSSVLKAVFARGKTLTPLRVVSGNQSGDMDSIISAISYSYFQYIHLQDFVLPFLNFKRWELESRKDVELVLKRHGIETSDLLFTDDLKNLRIDEVVLVDHNYPQGELKTYIEENETKVVGVIDHHDDEGHFQDVDPRIIEKSGSCSSLVFNYWDEKLLNQMDSEIVDLLIAPLLLDTSNLTSKVEQSDVRAFAKYKDFLMLDTASFYKELKEAKDDISSLTISQILAKDYKLFEFPVGTSESVMKVGISSIVKSFSWLSKKSATLPQEANEFLKINNLNMFIIMTAFKDPITTDFKREIIFFSPTGGDEILLHLLTNELQEELNLVQLNLVQGDSEGSYQHYEQWDVSKSRKQVAPAIKKVLERL